MKRSIKNLCLFIIIVLTLTYANPLNVYAISEESNYININNNENIEIGNLFFSNIKFQNYSSNSTSAFGLNGIVTNNSSNTISYTAKVSYYDLNYNLIAHEAASGTSIPGTSNFNQMSNLNILNGHGVDEICYYKLSIDINDSLNNTISNNTPSKNYKYNSYGYVIDKYDINIIVNENNTLDITETITAYFNIEKHGIFRTIPLKNTITRLDGSISKNRTQITNLYVDNDYTTSKKGGYYQIKIGSENKTLTGEHTYVIKYTYNLGKDPIKNYDELYFNIIGSEWDTVIGNISFSITMPKDFDSSKLGFSSGPVGSINNSNVKYIVSENKIIGNYNGILGVGEGLTIRCELPEGYFVNAGLSGNIMDYLMFIIPIVFLLISIIMWYIFGRDDVVIETVEFYPPEGLNSLDVGFLYKGQAENKDVTSLLIYLADKGYVEISTKKVDLDSKKINIGEEARKNADKKIIELQTKINEERKNNPSSKRIKYYLNMLDIYKNIDSSIDYEKYGVKKEINKYNKKEKFLIRKLKDYDGNDLHEQWFMDGLFDYGRTEVTDKMLYDNFYITNNSILQDINNKQNKDRVFEKNNLKINYCIIFMIILIYLIITIPPTLSYGDSNSLLFALIFPIVGFSILFGMLLGKTNILEKIFGIIYGLGFGGITWIFIVLPNLMEDTTYMCAYIIGIICMMVMIICLKYMQKRTKYGNEMLGKLRGFKNFLTIAEKEKLEELVLQNPNYLYDILPYAYVLGVSDKWISKFETMSLKAPTWYISSNSFDFKSFGNFMDSTMSTAENVMSSKVSTNSGIGSSSGSSSGGSSSGGGSSGGGSGGGGGGSW